MSSLVTLNGGTLDNTNSTLNVNKSNIILMQNYGISGGITDISRNMFTITNSSISIKNINNNLGFNNIWTGKNTFKGDVSFINTNTIIDASNTINLRSSTVNISGGTVNISGGTISIGSSNIVLPNIQPQKKNNVVFFDTATSALSYGTATSFSDDVSFNNANTQINSTSVIGLSGGVVNISGGTISLGSSNIVLPNIQSQKKNNVVFFDTVTSALSYGTATSFSDDVSFNNANTQINSTSVIGLSGGVVNISGGAVTIGNGTLNIGSATLLNGPTTLVGATTINGNTTIGGLTTVSGTTTVSGNTTFNNSTTQISSTSVLGLSGGMVNISGGTVNISGGAVNIGAANLSSLAVSGNATFNNATTQITSTSVVGLSGGTVNISGGVVNIAGTINNTNGRLISNAAIIPGKTDFCSMILGPSPLTNPDLGTYIAFDNKSQSGGKTYAVGSTGSLDGPGTGCFEIFDVSAYASRMVIDRNGNVGIGTATPSTELHVSSGKTNTPTVISVFNQAAGPNSGSDFSTAELRLGSSNGSYYTSIRNSYPAGVAGADVQRLDFCTPQGVNNNNQTVRMSITREGRVGIGTENPEHKVDINSGVVNSNNTYGLNIKSSGTGRGAGIKYNNTTGNGIWASYTTNTGHFHPIYDVSNSTSILEIAPNSTSAYFSGDIIANNGNISIYNGKGLYLNGGGNITMNYPNFYYTSGESRSNRIFQIIEVSQSGVWAGLNMDYVRNYPPSSTILKERVDFNFFSDTTGNRYPITTLTINNDGNVGIGTNTPAYPLVISRYYNNGGTHAEETASSIFLAANGAYGVGIRLRVAANATINGSDLQFTTSSNNSNEQLVRMTILGSSNVGGGYVGIGTASPSYPLHINSTGVYAENTATYFSYVSGRTLLTTGTVGSNFSIWVENYGIRASTFHAVSDSRIKNNIIDIDDEKALQTLRLIKPKTYDYLDKCKRGNTNVIGFIAQEIKEIIPKAVSIEKDYIPNFMTLCQISVTDTSNIVLVTSHIDLSWNSLHDQSGNAFVGSDGNAFSDAAGNKVFNVKLYDQSNNEIKCKTTDVLDKRSFLVDIADTKLSVGEYFLYGQEVDDFHTLDKQAIFTVVTAAVQDIDRIVQAQNAQVHAQASQIQAQNVQIQAQATQIQSLESKNTALELLVSQQQTQLAEQQTLIAQQQTQLAEHQSLIATQQAQINSILAKLGL